MIAGWERNIARGELPPSDEEVDGGPLQYRLSEPVKGKGQAFQKFGEHLRNFGSHFRDRSAEGSPGGFQLRPMIPGRLKGPGFRLRFP